MPPPRPASSRPRKTKPGMRRERPSARTTAPPRRRPRKTKPRPRAARTSCPSSASGDEPETPVAPASDPQPPMPNEATAPTAPIDCAPSVQNEAIAPAVDHSRPQNEAIAPAGGAGRLVPIVPVTAVALLALVFFAGIASVFERSADVLGPDLSPPGHRATERGPCFQDRLPAPDHESTKVRKHETERTSGPASASGMDQGTRPILLRAFVLSCFGDRFSGFECGQSATRPWSPRCVRRRERAEKARMPATSRARLIAPHPFRATIRAPRRERPHRLPRLMGGLLCLTPGSILVELFSAASRSW